MRLAFHISLLAIGLALWLGGSAASAGSLVEFPNVSEGEPKLLGYLARPAGEGPFPAVVSSTAAAASPAAARCNSPINCRIGVMSR